MYDSMYDSGKHASRKESVPEFLDKFIKLNPQLKEVSKPPLVHEPIQTADKESPARGTMPVRQQNIRRQESCFLDHREYWEDVPTGLPVIIGHTYCPQHRANEPRESHREDHGEDHRAKMERDSEKLAERGLAYLASDGSWYHRRTTLIVIARADVAARITLPRRENTADAATQDMRDMRERIPKIDWARILRDKLAQEAIKRDQLAELAPAEEQQGELPDRVQLLLRHRQHRPGGRIRQAGPRTVGAGQESYHKPAMAHSQLQLLR